MGKSILPNKYYSIYLIPLLLIIIANGLSFVISSGELPPLPSDKPLGVISDTLRIGALFLTGYLVARNFTTVIWRSWGAAVQIFFVDRLLVLVVVYFPYSRFLNGDIEDLSLLTTAAVLFVAFLPVVIVVSTLGAYCADGVPGIRGGNVPKR